MCITDARVKNKTNVHDVLTRWLFMASKGADARTDAIGCQGPDAAALYGLGDFGH